MARQYECCVMTLPFVSEWVWSKVRSNGTVLSLFLENKAEFQRSGKLKRLKSSYSLSSCLFEALSLPSSRSATDRQTDRQTDKQTNKVTAITMRAEG